MPFGNTPADYEERILKLEHEIQRLWALNAIQNLMSQYAYTHTASQFEKNLDCYAMQTPDVSVEIADFGKFVGPEALRQCYAINHKNIIEATCGPALLGVLSEHPLDTPNLQVAEDGLTAKGLWITPGHETFNIDGKHQAQWIWGKYAVDFIKEGNVWKIWHLHMFATFRCPYERPWTEVTTIGPHIIDSVERRILGEGASEPTTYCRPYDVNQKAEYWPAPPEPYDTFEGSRSMVGAPPEDWGL